MCNTLLDGQLNFWIFYLRFKQCSNQIGKKLAALSLNKVQTFWVLRSLEPEVQRHIWIKGQIVFCTLYFRIWYFCRFPSLLFPVFGKRAVWAQSIYCFYSNWLSTTSQTILMEYQHCKFREIKTILFLYDLDTTTGSASPKSIFQIEKRRIILPVHIRNSLLLCSWFLFLVSIFELIYRGI